jgi:hypothetical protein
MMMVMLLTYACFVKKLQSCYLSTIKPSIIGVFVFSVFQINGFKILFPENVEFQRQFPVVSRDFDKPPAFLVPAAFLSALGSPECKRFY